MHRTPATGQETIILFGPTITHPLQVRVRCVTIFDTLYIESQYNQFAKKEFKEGVFYECLPF